MTGIDFSAIFKTQVAGQIKRITELALQLEQQQEGSADNTPLLQNLMREFHTIKGASRAIDYEDIKDVAHVIEDIYHAILEAKLAVKLPILTDLTLFAIDLVSKLLDARINGTVFKGAEVLPELTQAYIKGELEQLPLATAPLIASDLPTESIEKASAIEKPANTEKQSETVVAQDSANKTSPSALKTDDYLKLTDSLMSLSGEMAVAVDSIGRHHLGMERLSHRTSGLQREMNILLNMMSESLRHAGMNTLVDRFSVFKQSFTELGKQQQGMLDFIEQADSRLHGISDDFSEQINNARLVPMSQLFDDYPRQIRDLSKQLGKRCQLKISGDEARIDRAVLDAVRAPLMHSIRNAIDHGIESPEHRLQQGKAESGTLSIKALPLGGQVRIIISDDGRGMDMEQIRQRVLERGDTSAEVWSSLTDHERIQFLFLPGFSTAENVTETSGRGFGMDIIKTDIERVGGHIDLNFEKDKGTTLIMDLPLSLSLTRCLLVNAGNHPFFGRQQVAFPLNDVADVRRINRDDISQVEGQDTININGKTVAIFQLAAIMQLSSHLKQAFDGHLILLEDAGQQIGLLVDDVLDERDIVIRNMDLRLGRMQNFQTITLMVDGSIALVADVHDLINTRSSSQLSDTTDHDSDTEIAIQQKHILVVEDSATVREIERHMLEEAGYRVTTAIDGVDGHNKLRGNQFDMLISDIDMPRMNGIELIKKIRANDRYQHLPIIVVSYKDRDEDKVLALQAGANQYVTKAAFDSGEMLASIRELSGE